MSYQTHRGAVSRSLGAGFLVVLLVYPFPAAAEAKGGANLPLIAQAPAGQDHAKAITAADTEVRVARDSLDEARRRLEAGRKPTSADRVNQLAGGGQYTDAYLLRVEQLQADVAKAQARLDAALKARKALDQ